MPRLFACRICLCRVKQASTRHDGDGNHEGAGTASALFGLEPCHEAFHGFICILLKHILNDFCLARLWALKYCFGLNRFDHCLSGFLSSTQLLGPQIHRFLRSVQHGSDHGDENHKGHKNDKGKTGAPGKSATRITRATRMTKAKQVLPESRRRESQGPQE